MEVGSVQSPTVVDALVAASSEAAADAHVATPGTAASPLLARESLAERLLGPMPIAADPSNTPARHVEHGAETGTAQTFGRPDRTPQAHRDAQARPDDAALPAASHALSDFALPASQLVPAALVGLQVQTAWIQPLPLPKTADIDAPPPPPRRPSHEDDDEPREHNHEPEEPEPEAAHPSTTPDTVPDPIEDDEGCRTLARRLQAALACAAPPPALLASREQWQRGRCVVLACPQGSDPEGPAWAFVMWPRRAPVRRPQERPRIELIGRHVAARLHWRRPPQGMQWLHSRMAKDHHPQRGRQLVPLTGDAVCEVQLGPVIADRRTSDVRLRIDAVRRFWTALGDQWSVLVVVCSMPLAGLAEEVASC